MILISCEISVHLNEIKFILSMENSIVVLVRIPELALSYRTQHEATKILDICGCISKSMKQVICFGLAFY